jgi:diadenosine tetraphosphate (Ap4A) HIT family hydrolase
VLPERHVLSFSRLPLDLLETGFAGAEELRSRLEPIYGAYIVAEHGPGGPCDFGAACVDHAHLHLIPLGDKTNAVREKYLERGGKPLKNGGPDVFKAIGEQSYVALSVRPGEYELWSAKRFPRQFVRMICADLLGLAPFYNWREHPFALKMKRTKLLCDSILGNDPEGRAA